MSEVVEEYTFYLIHPANTDKIQVYDETIRECYIGSTKNLDQRVSHHKYTCANPDYKGHNLKVYQYIRKTGGFDAWQISVLESYTITKADAKIHERWLIEMYEAELNSRVPSKTKTEYDIDHKEEKKAYDRARHASNREERNEKKRAYRAANRDRINEKKRSTRAAKKAASSI